jgi:hypothetical protein
MTRRGFAFFRMSESRVMKYEDILKEQELREKIA